MAISPSAKELPNFCRISRRQILLQLNQVMTLGRTTLVKCFNRIRVCQYGNIIYFELQNFNILVFHRQSTSGVTFSLSTTWTRPNFYLVFDVAAETVRTPLHCTLNDGALRLAVACRGTLFQSTCTALSVAFLVSSRSVAEQKRSLHLGGQCVLL